MAWHWKPAIVRAEQRENCNVAGIQRFFRRNGTEEKWRLFFLKLRVRIKDNKTSPHGKFHRFLYLFSNKFYACYETRAWHTVSLGYLCFYRNSKFKEVNVQFKVANRQFEMALIGTVLQSIAVMLEKCWKLLPAWLFAWHFVSHAIFCRATWKRVGIGSIPFRLPLHWLRMHDSPSVNCFCIARLEFTGELGD